MVSGFSNFIYSTLIMLPGIIIALSFHEFAHAFVSDRLGDPTPRNQGRLTLHPSAHLDFLGLAFIILARFGWGKPVQINPSYYKHPRRDMALVSVAGITMNLLVAFVMGLFLKLLIYFGAQNLLGFVTYQNLLQILFVALQINVYLALFNLIPIPPLDGFNIFTNIFKTRNGKFVEHAYRYGIYILLFAIITGLVSDIIVPPALCIIRMIRYILAF